MGHQVYPLLKVQLLRWEERDFGATNVALSVRAVTSRDHDRRLGTMLDCSCEAQAFHRHREQQQDSTSQMSEEMNTADHLGEHHTITRERNMYIGACASTFQNG